jgi:hypothetical protein
MSTEQLRTELLSRIRAKVGNEVIRGKILYDFTQEQLDNFVHVEGATPETPALHEIHIFLSALNPTEEQIRLYTWLVKEYNSVYNGSSSSFKEMKAPLLALYFRNKDAYISVLQSSRYILCNDKEKIIEETYKDAEIFLIAGFDVIRLKIEASLHGTKKLPKSAEELTTYYEHHIRVKKVVECSPEEETRILNDLSIHYSNELKIPIPLSYNRNDKEGRRYLNARFRNMGADKALEKLRAIVDHINAGGNFKVVNTIDEIIICDSFVALDKGWIDYTEEEMKAFGYITN